MNAIFEYISGLRGAYQQTFGRLNAEGAGRYVLEDLSKFCYANETTANDPIKEGRRQVWLRIQEQLHLSTEQLVALNENRLAKRITNG